MVRRQRQPARLTWWLAVVAVALSLWAVYAASQGPRSPELERILQENCPGWVC